MRRAAEVEIFGVGDRGVRRTAVIDAQQSGLSVALDQDRVPLVVVDVHVDVERLPIVAQIEQQAQFAFDQFQIEEIELASIVDVGERAVVRVRSNVEPNVPVQTRPP